MRAFQANVRAVTLLQSSSATRLAQRMRDKSLHRAITVPHDVGVG